MIENPLRYLLRSSKKPADPFSKARDFMLNSGGFRVTGVFDPRTSIRQETPMPQPEPSHHRRQRRFVPPFGWPPHFRAVTITPAGRPRLITLNRYPRQIIGVVIRLPDADDTIPREQRSRSSHRALSLLWARPARWWA